VAADHHFARRSLMPSPFIALVIALAAYRLTRLAGWDDFPLAARIRAWAIGERWIEPPSGKQYATLDDAARAIARWEDAGGADEVGLPGKQPPSEVEGVRPAYDRPTLAHLVHCPYCIGFYLSAGTYTFWLWQPHWSMFVLMPFALSGVVGLIAKNLDP
jgi:hypothetical protein